MHRTTLNLFVEFLGLIAFSLMTATGIVLQWILLPGAGRIEMLGHGRRHQNIDVYLGYTRHEWGELHWWCGVVFLVLMVLHLALHWRWLVAVLWGTSTRPQPFVRRAAVTISLLIIVLPVIAVLAGTKETQSAEEFRTERAGAEAAGSD